MKLRFTIKSKLLLLVLTMIIITAVSLSYIVLFNLPNIEKLNVLSRLDVLLQLGIEVLLVVCVLAAVSALIIRFITEPIQSLLNNISLIKQGVLPRKIKKKSNDEIGDIAEIMNQHIESLKNTVRFTQSLGEGQFDENYKPLSEYDALGNSLINMHNNLKIGDNNERLRLWVMNGVAELSEIVRRHVEISKLSEECIQFLTSKINALQGAFYIVRTKEKEDSEIELKYSYAYNRKKYLKASFKWGEGLVGQSAIEGSTIYRTEIPSDYCTISSGILGEQKPRSILIVPLITDDKVYGLVEFASLHVFQKTEIKLIEEIGPIIARTIFNIHIAERTQKHLKQSRQMGEELREQQEELQRNAVKMQQTQEELKQSNIKLEEQIEEVNRTQKRMQLLLENASEVITIYESDGKIRYISPSVINILGYVPEELIGGKVDNYIHEEDFYLLQEMFHLLIQSPEKQLTVQYRFATKDNQWIWIESNGKNLLSDPSVKGIVINSRDITTKRKAEVEERMRKNMQALSENSPDLITRLSIDGKIAYTNPVIETYSGNNANYFLNKSISAPELNSSIIQSWNGILEKVKSKNETISLEVNYSSPIGDRMMQVNAIPEFNENKMESILIVSHDITERKSIELEIQAKNKSINESINYSKRIQNAILPDTKVLHKIFPQAFILYKPRDVVSGDFPWFKTKGDDLFIAAVDCTGHGVPGAMLSLVGYFHLNNIIDTNASLNAGEILDLLDSQVNATLIKDTNEENIKDGMDVALCKINTKTNTIEYAGAHRPLYHYKNNEIIEYKGDKWAIGGGVYKNQTQFTNYKLVYKKNDSIYFFSDGLPDQFGGPQQRKFSTTRIKDIILTNQNKNMQDQSEVFNYEIDTWKGTTKQTDDILLIGIKF